MTIELRKPGQVEPAAAHAPVRWERARQHVVARRMAVVHVTRKHAWTAWKVGKQLPGTALLLIAYSPRGLARVAMMIGRYAVDTDSAVLRAQHASQKESDHYAKVSAVRSANLAARARVIAAVGGLVVTLAMLWWAPDVLKWVAALVVFAAALKILPLRDWHEVLVAAAAGLLTYFAVQIGAPLVPRPPTWLLTIAAIGIVAGLGWAGRPIAKPLIKGMDLHIGGPAPLTAPLTTAALCALGIAGMRNPDDIRLLHDVHRRGPGVQVEVELPGSVPATAIMDKREELAAALRRELGCVWPSVGSRHPGHLVLYVANEPMVKARQSEWPLLRTGAVDLFRPVDVATDQAGDWVKITLAYSSAVIGAVPRQGKTFFLRELLLIAGLDPRARVFAFDGKGTGDLSCCGEYAEYVGVGDEAEDIDEQLEKMRGLRAELRRRAKVIRGLSREECPESKVTSALASRRDLGLEPIVVGVDETQTWFEYGDKGNKEHKAIREEFAAICTDLAKRGPALGFILLLATQQVNANTIPTSISNNAVIRFCLKVFGHVANDQILGTGARKEGIDATMFSPADKGIGYLRADGADAQIVRTVAGLDAVAAEKVAQRARGLRVATGRLPDEGIVDADVVVDLVDDALRAMDARQREKAQHGELIEWLQEMRPEHADLDVEALSARLRAASVPVVQVRSGETNRRGVRAADLRKCREGDTS